MIYLLTGTPGSGKSLDAANRIIKALKWGKTVIANFPCNTKVVGSYKGKFYYVDETELKPEDLIEFAKRNHKKGKEGQSIIVIDECQRLFDSRSYNQPDRKEWNRFMQLHRHYGYDVILITQFDRMIDRQMRALVEYEVKHRKITNYGIGGTLIGLFFGDAWFIAIEKWYGMNEKIGDYSFRGNKKLYEFYDSYEHF